MPRSCRTASASSATFSAALKDVTVVLPLISNSIGEGSKGNDSLRAIWNAKHLIAFVGSSPIPSRTRSNSPLSPVVFPSCSAEFFFCGKLDSEGMMAGKCTTYRRDGVKWVRE